MADTSTTKSLALISQYLYSVQIAQDKAFKGGSINSGRDMVMYMQRKALDYGINQSLTGLQGVANNIYALIGGKLQLANEILSTGSSGIVVSSSSGSGSLTPVVVGMLLQASQLGGTPASTTVHALIPSDWIGLTLFNTVIIQQGTYTLNQQFTYNPTNGVFDFALNPYYPQVGEWFGFTAFKSV